eukprot:Skav208171  [mRNA]  locus=scaffold3606:23359:25512:+ [translate_table: standard]
MRAILLLLCTVVLALRPEHVEEHVHDRQVDEKTEASAGKGYCEPWTKSNWAKKCPDRGEDDCKKKSECRWCEPRLGGLAGAKCNKG